MTYAGNRLILDADSHLMERLDWLADHADPDVREKLLSFDFSSEGCNAPDDLVRKCWERSNDPEETAKVAASVMDGPKGYFAYGSMNPDERKIALDQMGFSAQLVFTTFAPLQVSLRSEPALRYGAARAHNRAIVDWCSVDSRLLPVGYIPTDDAEQAIACLDEALALGIKAAWFPHGVPAEKSLTHPDYNGLWARLEETGIPMVIHGGFPMERSYHNNGRDPGRDFVGGAGDSLRSKDFLNLYHDAENLIACFALDGIFEQFPRLKLGVIEIGAGWVPNLLHSLDASVKAFGRFEPELKKLTLSASDYVRRNVRFTPWHFEDIGNLINTCGSDMFLFSSDWPHPEGGKDPLGAFEKWLDKAGIAEHDRQKFYWQNSAELFDLTHSLATA